MSTIKAMSHLDQYERRFAYVIIAIVLDKYYKYKEEDRDHVQVENIHFGIKDFGDDKSVLELQEIARMEGKYSEKPKETAQRMLCSLCKKKVLKPVLEFCDTYKLRKGSPLYGYAVEDLEDTYERHKTAG